MNKIENLLSHAAEEAAEISQVALKCVRFGLQDHWPEPDSPTPAEKLAREIDDLAGVVIELREAGLIPPSDPARIQAKREKIVKFQEYSRRVGTLQIDK